MKVRLMAEITDNNGKKVMKPIEIETEVPDIEEFGDKSQFYEVFDRYEKPVLAAHTQFMEELTKRYMNEAAALKKEGSKSGQ